MATGNRRACTFLLYIFLIFIALQYCSTSDTLTPYQPISVNQTLVSASQIFELGFFIPGNSTNRYVGIWHKNVIQPIHVWVANRKSPVNLMDSASSLTIGSDGNLELLDGKQNTVWSTNVSVRSNDTIAVLFDTGNFALMDRVSRLYLWESFDYPCDTLLPTMKLGMINTSGEKHLSSWQTKDDPSPGKFLVGLSLELPPQSFTWNESNPYWRGGPWDGKFLGIPEQDSGYTNGMSIQQDTQQGTAYLTWNTYNISAVCVIIITPAGFLLGLVLDDETREWIVNWRAPDNPCDVYGTCGPFGVCNKNRSRICQCAKGFMPKSKEEWSKGNWTSGCVRRTELFCEQNVSTLAPRRAKNDGFWKTSGMKLPNYIEYVNNEDAPGCKQWCLNNCSCLAYAYTGLGCMVWTADLIDIQQFSFSGEDLFLRLAHSELGEEKKSEKLIISFTTISGVLFVCASMYGLHRWKAYQRGRRRRIEGLNFGDTSETSKETAQEDSLQQDSIELPMFDFAKIVAATNNFSESNKLGKGGFGTVYKGMLEDGHEIAVKRLSSNSGQGVEEFKNEIILISKLQHRNLVRLVGCCIEGEEKLIIYEYMSNKSLDTFLFDPKKGAQLDWAKRFNIIQGIARGLLYLHRDSCLRIIHRDLKGSNILLDDQMNPKISDFGLARTFQMTQELANTHRIVGTFGYMSPEYAMAGIFSEKSDVFSFGVMLLEIVSSKKNTSFHYHEQHMNLLGYAWKLWNEDRGLELIDREAMGDSYCKSQVMRCVHVGLLCVQDQAADRPTMPAIVVMLSSETDLPQPKQSTFTFQCLLDSDLRSKCNKFSINEASVSTIEGR